MRHCYSVFRGVVRSLSRTCDAAKPSPTSLVLADAREHSGVAALTTFFRLRHWTSTALRPGQNSQGPAHDTIYALSSGSGRAAIAIVRISGPACLDIYQRLCPGRQLPHPRQATLRRLFDPEQDTDGERQLLDANALVLYFPSPRTVTGEDVLELHVHGGTAVVRAILNAIPRSLQSATLEYSTNRNVIRHADPGEFTKRGFYNGRIDLTQTEALGDLLAAETEQQRRLAVSGTQGNLARRYEQWQSMLLLARGELEALIDFSDDQYFDESPQEFVSSVCKQIRALRQQIKMHIENASKGELLRRGINIALLGAPNAGKSSLLNRIVGRDAAIVSMEEGTTRDIVDVSVDIRGWLCKLGDMAGIRSESRSTFRSMPAACPIGSVEREGIQRAIARALESDVVIVLLSLEHAAPDIGDLQLPISDEVVATARKCQQTGKQVLIALNKVDRLRPSSRQNDLASFTSRIHETFPETPIERIIPISCKDAESVLDDPTGDPGNLQKLLQSLTSVFEDITAVSAGDDASLIAAGAPQHYWNAALSISQRQSTYLATCAAHLDDFLLQVRHSVIGMPEWSNLAAVLDKTVDEAESRVTSDDAIDVVAAAEHLRFAAECLAKITGKGQGGDVEDVLGVVFEK